MKKIPILFLLILLFGLILSPVAPTHAAIEEKGTTWWSVAELLEFYQEVEAEKNTECGDNEECKMEFNLNMIEKGPEYSALNNLLEAQIWVTSVNPAAETVKILYFDDEMMAKFMGIEEKIHLEHLYMGWIEDWDGQIYNYNHEQFTGGSMAGNHPMYDGSSYLDGADWIPAWQEYELSVAGSNLTQNTLGRIDYAVYAEDNMFNAQGYFDYSNCISASDYQEGMECKMMVSGDQWVAYFPPRAELKSEIGPFSATPTTDLGGDIILEENNTAYSIETSSQSSTSSVKAPHTGSMTNPCIQKTVEFPWWLVILIAIGNIVVLWIFWPKSRKNHKKTLDKIDQVR